MDLNQESITLWLRELVPGESLHVVPVSAEGGDEDTFEISRTDESAAIVRWSPTTFKEILDHALRLSHVVGEMSAGMSFLAERENALRELRNLIQAPVKKATTEATSAVCIAFGERPTVMGLWVPDLIDRAGGRSMLLESGDPDTPLDVRDLSTARPEVLFFASDQEWSESESIILSRANRIIDTIDFTGAAYLLDHRRLSLPSPDLYRSVAVLAAGLHPDIDGLEETRRDLNKIC